MKISLSRKIQTKNLRVLLLITMTLTLLTGNAWGYGERNGERQGGPPQEAINACAGKSTGEIVEFKNPRGSMVKATCTERDGQLVAVPERKRQGQRARIQ